MLLVLKCECENIYSRESGKGKGYPCQDLDRYCTSICNCGKKSADKISKNCKNRMGRADM